MRKAIKDFLNVFTCVKILKILVVIGVALFWLFVCPIPKVTEQDFYDYHVWECEEAHKQNMTYLLCSGFWRAPEDYDFEFDCAWHPQEDCRTIPHGSVTGQTHMVFAWGIYGWVTTPEYY